MPSNVGVPIKLLHESEGHIVTVELTNGEIYRGLMVDGEDCMNIQLSNGQSRPGGGLVWFGRLPEPETKHTEVSFT